MVSHAMNRYFLTYTVYKLYTFVNLKASESNNKLQ